ncbi:TIR domain-containing protein [Frankia sp. AgB1.9]|uniref:TIR domain-containing protein n=1 Tax=unclassified Frankia TaxID=2632575 RepID=UPI00193207DB|nr:MULTISPECIES: TIR domain-containing protein [unclassified Frankia]MBL7487466.1 TIR domain-containing protein [Frankia sp. AgW1.1]MBL7547428.1 TIR domain-containing protein [Frankia sp. AgB1.9]MBL7618797.1 TIR domain-containing protein [Frankia sp. AgB1.8]
MRPSGEREEWDFFVSYASADVAWAQWIAWQLEDAGSKVLIGAWDFVPGAHWMSRMAEGVRASARVLAVVSPAYLESVYGQHEWQAALRQDPGGFARKLLPVRIKDCPLPDLLDGVVAVDLFSLGEDEARQALQTAVRALETGRAKPETEPPFPGAMALGNSAMPDSRSRTFASPDPARKQVGSAPPSSAGHERSRPHVSASASNPRAAGRSQAPDRPAILSVQAIDIDPRADDADITLNWMHLYDGEQPRTRVAPRDPADWQTMDRELTQAAAELEAGGWDTTLLRGAMRQATFFRVGTLLPMVRQHTIQYRQGSRIWSTDNPKAPIAAPQTRQTRLDQGGDLAVAVGVTLDPTEEIVRYLATARVPISTLITVTPAAGADDQSVAGPGEAVAYAEQIRNRVRAAVAEHAATARIHLFLAGPGGLALLLGSRWNRLRETVVYEHLGAGHGYTPAFTVET